MKDFKTIQAVPGSGVVWQAFRAAAPQTVPVFAGYLVLGMGYGIYVQSLGLPVWMPMLMGTVVYGGSLEFVLASLLLGAVVGSVLPFSTKGVDFVMTAMFVVIFLNQWEKEKQHYSGIIGLAVPLVCLVLFGSGSFLLPSMACILVLLLVLRKPIERADGIVPGQTEKQKEAAQ